MDLIKRLYESNNVDLERERPFILFDDLNDIDKLASFLEYTHCFDTDLSYIDLEINLVNMFSKLGFGLTDCFHLHSMKIGPSRYNIKKEGYCSFGYSLESLDSLECNDGDVLSYYSSSELFNDDASMCPGVKLISGNSSLYYTVGTGPYIRKYDIKINEEVTLTREFSKDDVFFIYEQQGKCFVIKINKPNNKVVTNDYVLDNELELVEYLKNLTSFDIVKIYNKLCEISLGNDISIYPEISLCESIKTDYGYQDINSLIITHGNLDCVVKTVGDKSLSLNGNGNWNYILSNENINFRINSGKTLKYGIETKNDKTMNDYIKSLLNFDVSEAREEVEDTKKLVKALGIGVKKGR